MSGEVLPVEEGRMIDLKKEPTEASLLADKESKDLRLELEEDFGAAVWLAGIEIGVAGASSLTRTGGGTSEEAAKGKLGGMSEGAAAKIGEMEVEKINKTENNAKNILNVFCFVFTMSISVSILTQSMGGGRSEHVDNFYSPSRQLSME